MGRGRGGPGREGGRAACLPAWHPLTAGLSGFTDTDVLLWVLSTFRAGSPVSRGGCPVPCGRPAASHQMPSLCRSPSSNNRPWWGAAGLMGRTQAAVVGGSPRSGGQSGAGRWGRWSRRKFPSAQGVVMSLGPPGGGSRDLGGKVSIEAAGGPFGMECIH